MNNTPLTSRVHIGIFGLRNAGKSSVINAITGQELAIVSDTAGTTTDPVYKSMEILPLGPVVLIDTAGLDDEGELGKKRIEKTLQVLDKIDIAVLVCPLKKQLERTELDLLAKFKEQSIPHIVVYNKIDVLGDIKPQTEGFFVSAKTGEGINELREKIAKLQPPSTVMSPLISDLITKDDWVVLVTPIDSAAPKGRIILPQQQVLREVLDMHALATVTQTEDLPRVLEGLKNKPKLVVTDSQAFKAVAPMVPEDIELTSFSILFARQKGLLEDSIVGVNAVKALKDGAKVLIVEGCTHHRQCDDIGTVKLPRWIKQSTQKEIEFNFCSGVDFPDDLSGYSLIVHCGGCMLQNKVVQRRLQRAKAQGIPFTNYGILIAHMNNILQKSIAPLGLSV